jgi:hypothetical protein
MEFKDIFINDIKHLKRDNFQLKGENTLLNKKVSKLENEIFRLEDDIFTIKKMLSVIISNNPNLNPSDNIKEIIMIQRFFKRILTKKKQMLFYKLYFSFKKWLINVKFLSKITNNIKLLSDIKINKIWYMNGNFEDIKHWDLFIKNNILLTWNHEGKNEKVKSKVKTGDIIVWYVVSKGFNSIVKVIDTPKPINDDQLIKLLASWKKKYNSLDELKKHQKDNNYERLVIPVEFLTTTNKHFVNQNNILKWGDKKWSFGFHGSHAIHPSNEHWREQVIEIYKYLITKD